MKKQTFAYHPEQGEKFIDHPELEYFEKEHRNLKMTMHLKFVWSFVKSLIVILVAFAIFLALFYYYAKSRVGA